MLFFWTIYVLWVAVLWRAIVVRGGDPRIQAAWMMAAVLLPPLAGAMFVMLAGRRVRRVPGERLSSAVESIVAAGCSTRCVQGNRVEVSPTVSAAFSSMISDMQRARSTIHVEYYILTCDRLGMAILSLLRRKARAVVSVRVLCDAYGSRRLPRSLVRSLSRDGVRIRFDSPIVFPYFRWATHCRNHRKMVIVDSRTAHVGGINIASRYLDGDTLGRWYDEQVRLTGGAVADLERLFTSDWVRSGGEPIEAAVPSLRGLRMPLPGRAAVQAAWSEHGISRTTIADAIAAAMAQAQRTIHIVTPYFLPPQWLLDSLRRASASGVGVVLMLPSRCDSSIVCMAARSYVAECVEMGIDVVIYDEGFLHSKLIVIDSCRVLIGSMNLDYRSMDYNRELMLVIDDCPTAQRYAESVAAMMSRCRRVTAEDTESGRWRCGTAARLARLLSPLM